MKHNNKKTTWWVSTTAALTLVASASAFAVDNLRFATTHAPQTHFNNRALTPWAERITEQYGDVLRIQAIQGNAIANQGNIFDRVLSNAVQIGWGVHSTVSGQFPGTGVTYIPGVIEPEDYPHASEIASAALWRMYESGALGNEYDELMPLALVAFPQYDLHLRSAVGGLSDLRGKRLMMGSSLHAEMVSQLGGVPMTVSSADTYQGLSRGTIDGTFNVWTAFAPFRLEEVTTYHMSLGAGAPTGLVFMRRDAFEALSPEAQAALMAESGEKLSRQIGAIFDEVSQATQARILAQENHHDVTLTTPERARLNAVYTQMRQRWIDETPNGAALYLQYRQHVAALRQEF